MKLNSPISIKTIKERKKIRNILRNLQFDEEEYKFIGAAEIYLKKIKKLNQKQENILELNSYNEFDNEFFNNENEENYCNDCKKKKKNKKTCFIYNEKLNVYIIHPFYILK
jgi:transcription antitermination factor NusA-like protein